MSIDSVQVNHLFYYVLIINEQVFIKIQKYLSKNDKYLN